MEIIQTTTVCVSARIIREDGIVDEFAPQTHGWRYRISGRFQNDQEAIDLAIKYARARYGATHENFRFDKRGDNEMEIPDERVRGGIRFGTRYQYERGEY